MADSTRLAAEGTTYTRFIILSGARTGSTMLAQALQSNPEITCFREVFNFSLNAIDYEVDGYDKANKEDMDLRSRDPTGFLRERIFCRHPAEIRAVGFKFHYGHFWPYPSLWEALAADTQIRVIHLKRRNILRMLLSYKIAETTGVWQVQHESYIRDAAQRASEVKRKLTPANALAALRQPSRAVAFFRRALQPRQPRPKAARTPEVISDDEFVEFLTTTGLTIKHFDELFHGHPALTVFYEDLVADSENTFRDVQTFLDVDPQALTVSLRRQNPEHLRQLIANYDELHATFQDTPYAWMFED